MLEVVKATQKSHNIGVPIQSFEMVEFFVLIFLLLMTHKAGVSAAKFTIS